jgi:hypothetical protein
MPRIETTCRAGSTQTRGARHGLERVATPDILAVQRLDGCLLINAEHRRMRRRIQIQPNNVRRLGLEAWVIGCHVAIKPLWLQTVLNPDPRYHHGADLKLTAQFARAPLSRAVQRLAHDCPVQDARLERRGKRAGLLSGVPAEQPCQPFFAESFPPTINECIVAIQLVSYRFPGAAGFQQQNLSCTARIICTPAATRRSLI